MKYLFLMLFLSGASFLYSQDSGFRVLIYTHNGEGFVHENVEAGASAIASLCKKNDIQATISDDPSLFTDPDLMQYDAIIFANTNPEAFTSDAQRLAFQQFIRSGKGFAGIHYASGSEPEWPWYTALIGGKFVRHPPFQPFDICIIDPDHPSTRHLPETWKWEDECYLHDHLNPDIHILAAVNLNTVVDEHKDEYPGVVFGHYFPLIWCHEFDGSRVWYSALGHTAEHYTDPRFLEHIEGGLRWILEIE